MGKIKQVIMGDIEAEEKTRAKAATKREQKKIREGEDVTVVEKKVEKKLTKKTVSVVGKNYTEAVKKIDKNKTFSPADGIALLKDIAYAKFNETVELVINVTEKGIRGNVALPHGTGKEVKVRIADDELVTAIEKGGKIDFDILVASPDMMPRLARVAKILGPRGLMPNPKTGTIGPNPEALALSLSKGQIQYKTESVFPIIHTIIGKLDFEDKKLLENFQAILKAIGKDKVVSMFLKSTMSPAVRIQI
ncbi:MAG: 50S ribosomal protein L1 [bacterium]|nr:50S ribosomal protein L1 [bacterium]